jgi:signal transduction histidine kinase
VVLEQQRSEQRILALADLGRNVLQGGSLPDIFRHVAEALNAALGLERSEVWEFDPARHALSLVHRAPVSERDKPDATAALEETNPIARAFLQRQPVVARLNGQGTVAATVVRGKAAPFGVLAAYAQPGATFAPADVALLRATANLLAFATEAKREAERLKLDETKAAALADLGRRALLGEPLSEIFRAACATIAELCRFDYARIMRYESDRRVLVPAAGIGWFPSRDLVIPLDEDLPATRAFRSRADVVGHADGGDALARSLRSFGVVSALSTIVRGSDVPYGTLSVGTTVRHEFTAAEINFVRAIANTLAAAIQRSLVDESQAFSYGVAHDLRAPLRGIAGFAQALSEDYGECLPGEGQNYLARIINAADRMGTLIDALLQYVQLADREIARTLVDVSALAASVADGLKNTEPQRAVTFAIAPGMTANADRALLHNLLQNLMANAWKFTRTKAQARIEVASERRGGEEIFWVRDNGVGFAPQDEHKLFVPFKRLRPAEYEGAGLGLAGVARIVRHHRGRIWATGEPDAGATFYFTLERPAP